MLRKDSSIFVWYKLIIIWFGEQKWQKKSCVTHDKNGKVRRSNLFTVELITSSCLISSCNLISVCCLAVSNKYKPTRQSYCISSNPKS